MGEQNLCACAAGDVALKIGVLGRGFMARPQFLLSKQKGRGHLRGLRRRTCRSLPFLTVFLGVRLLALAATPRPVALLLLVSSATTSLIPSTQNQGTIAWSSKASNNLKTPSRASFFVQTGSAIQASFCSWEPWGVICVSQSAMCIGVP